MVEKKWKTGQMGNPRKWKKWKNGNMEKLKKTTKFRNLPTKYFTRKNLCFTSRPKNGKPEKWKIPKKWKNEKNEKLMFLSGTLPAGPFFFFWKNTFPVKILLSPSKSYFPCRNRNFPCQNRNFPWRNQNFSFK